MTDIFISYKREERDDCERIANKLKALDLDVWFDARLTAGDSYTAEIEREVKRAKAVLVLWSPGSVASRWVRNEADMGRENSKLAAVQIKPCDMPIEFRDIHYDPLHDPNFTDDDPQWLKVLDRIGQLTGKPMLSSFSKVLGSSGRPLRQWADANALDPLAKKARLLADQVGVLGSGPLTATVVNRQKPSGPPIVAIALSALIAAGAAGAGVWFGKTWLEETASAAKRDSAPAPASLTASAVAPASSPSVAVSAKPTVPDPFAEAANLAGYWNPFGGANGCAADIRLTVRIQGSKLLFYDDPEEIIGLANGWVETIAADKLVKQYRVHGGKLELRARGKEGVLGMEPCR